MPVRPNAISHRSKRRPLPDHELQRARADQGPERRPGTVQPVFGHRRRRYRRYYDDRTGGHRYDDDNRRVIISGGNIHQLGRGDAGCDADDRRGGRCAVGGLGCSGCFVGRGLTVGYGDMMLKTEYFVPGS
jgi:hypothetical protein